METNDIDVVISPTALAGIPPLVDDPNRNSGKNRNPVYEFKDDYFTAFPNTLGISSMTLPISEEQHMVDGKMVPVNPFPSSVKVCTYFGEDYHLFRIARQMEIMIEEAGIAYDPKGKELYK